MTTNTTQRNTPPTPADEDQFTATWCANCAHNWPWRHCDLSFVDWLAARGFREGEVLRTGYGPCACSAWRERRYSVNPDDA